MKAIIKAIEKQIENDALAEVHTRYDGDAKEADMLSVRVARLVDLLERAKEIG